MTPRVFLDTESEYPARSSVCCARCGSPTALRLVSGRFWCRRYVDGGPCEFLIGETSSAELVEGVPSES